MVKHVFPRVWWSESASNSTIQQFNNSRVLQIFRHHREGRREMFMFQVLFHAGEGLNSKEPLYAELHYLDRYMKENGNFSDSECIR